jgi:hypothetical protein
MPLENLTPLTEENLSRYHTWQKCPGQGNEFRQVCAHQEVRRRSSVGLEYPAITGRALPLQPVRLMWTDASLDDARQHLVELVPPRRPGRRGNGPVAPAPLRGPASQAQWCLPPWRSCSDSPPHLRGDWAITSHVATLRTDFRRLPRSGRFTSTRSSGPHHFDLDAATYWSATPPGFSCSIVRCTQTGFCSIWLMMSPRSGSCCRPVSRSPIERLEQ